MRINIIVLAAIAAGSLARAQLGMVPQLQNSPFTAEIVSTQVQTLADGTHITQPERTTKVYRDSLGRTRTESPVAPPGVPLQTPPISTRIAIVDPVEGFQYMFSTNTKTAQKLVLPKRNQAMISRPPGNGPPPQGAVMLYGGVAFSPGVPGAAPRPLPFGGGGGGQATPGPTSKNESLGTQTIEGLAVEGHRTTTTWAAGSSMGNDRDVVTYNETWRSTELGVTMLSTNSDPRNGERTTKVINISRAEPDPALFQVPPDYTIEEPQKSAGPPASPSGIVR